MKSAAKFGIGLDLGFVYEWRPDWKSYKYDMDGETNIWRRDQEKYKMRVGMSILDIGGMKFAKGGLSRDFSVNTDNPFYFREAFDGAGNWGQIHCCPEICWARGSNLMINIDFFRL
jgi:hypothetical protein